MRCLEEQIRQRADHGSDRHLAGGIAHDFNNILTGILGYLVLAAEHPGVFNVKLKRYLDQAQASGLRAWT